MRSPYGLFPSISKILSMQWSKAKKRFESLLASSLQNRLKVFVTKYNDTSGFDIGRGWITLDGKEIVSVMTPSFYSNNFYFRTETLDFGKAIVSYINISIAEIKKSEDELIQGFMFLDKRIGKRFMKNIKPDSLYPFPQKLYFLRAELDINNN